jgi:hypothetical protein
MIIAHRAVGMETWSAVMAVLVPSISDASIRPSTRVPSRMNGSVMSVLLLVFLDQN